MTPQPFAFISYTKTDETFVAKLETDLKAMGVRTLSMRDFPAGVFWDMLVEQEVPRSSVVVFVVSEAFTVSEETRREMHFVDRKKKIMLPVLCEECDLPLLFSGIIYIPLHENYQSGLARLGDELKKAFAIPVGERPGAQPRSAAPAPTSLDLSADTLKAAAITISPELLARALKIAIAEQTRETPAAAPSILSADVLSPTAPYPGVSA